MAEKKTRPVNLSAIKREKQSKKRMLRNKSLKSFLRTELKKFFALVKEKPAEVKASLPTWHKVIDRAHSQGIISKNSASRKKSKVDTLANALKV